MGRASATTTVPGPAVDAQALWDDPVRWPAWLDGFGHLVRLDDGWPRAGASRLWQARAGGRGRVLERVVAYEDAAGQTLAVEDERLRGTQEVRFETAGAGTRVTLSLEYAVKQPRPLLDWLVVRRSVGDSLRRTLSRFAREREGDLRPP